MPKFIDMTGCMFGKLTVIKREANNIQPNRGQKTMWLCQCDCGNKVIVSGTHLRSGHTKSCGCINFSHGMCGTRLHRIWSNIKSRCNNPKDKDFKNYGERGIIICKTWSNDFKSFHEWSISNGYKNNLTIDRKDVNGNYEPSNCRWLTIKEQENNRRNNRIIIYNGIALTAAQTADKYGISRNVFYARLRYNWEIEKIINTPIQKRTCKRRKAKCL